LTKQQSKRVSWDTQYPLLIRKREVRLIKARSEEFKGILTVFIGIFNGEMYLQDVRSQLEAQVDKNVDLLIVDNFSQDQSWHLLSMLPFSEFQGSVTLVRNSVNCGATGSFYVNLDLLATEWVTFWHQDDTYLPNHIDVLVGGLQGVNEKVVALSTRMGSRDVDGKVLPTPPRAFELVDYRDRTLALSATIKNHLIPWPCTAFKVVALRQAESPWHSSSFHDTEISMHLILLGDLEFLDIETMLYTENPMSGSHELENSERILGAFLAIHRFISSSNFINHLKSLSWRDHDNLLSMVSSSISARIQIEPYCSILITALYESASFATRYESAIAALELSELYYRVGGQTTATLLTNLALETNGQKGLNFKGKEFQAEGPPFGSGATGGGGRELSVSKLRVLIWGWAVRINRPLALALLRIYARAFKAETWRL
jgi:glycosyltransferase involved in cell wall biosynthesis